jgi:hypothetical protein
LTTQAPNIQSIVPIDVESMVVTWDFVVTPPVLPDGVPEDLTRYIITVDRVNGACFTPVVKFQVPVSHTPLNDCCGLSQASKLKGTSQTFHVKLCAGERLLVGVTKTIGENCLPGQCGLGPTAGTQQTEVATINSAIVNLFLF